MNIQTRMALGLLAALAASCQLTPSVSVIPRIGPLAIGGDLRVSSSGASVGTSADDLGLDDDDSVFQPRADLSWGPAHIMVTGYEAKYEGNGRAEGQIDLGGVVINAGDQVESSLEVKSLNLVTTFDLIPTKLVDIGIGLGARVIDFDGRIRSRTSGQSVDTDETFAMPVAAVRVATALGPFELSAIGSGLTGTYAGIDAQVFDLDVMGEYRFDRFLGFHGALVAGYRYIDIDFDYDDNGADIDADLDFQGPYIGLALGN